MIVGTDYRSTGINYPNNKNLLKLLDKACNVKSMNYVLVMGDFNLRTIWWLEEKIDLTHDFF